jgi:GMP synthase (glutamine-hydrolysing)
MHDFVLILDFGSQYTQLIARNVRALHIYCEIVPYNIDIGSLKEKNPKALIFSGSPASISNPDPPMPVDGIWQLSIPILGICYGLQLIVHKYGGQIAKAEKKEYGRAELVIDNPTDLFYGMEKNQTVWMSHGDEAKSIPDCFDIIAHTSNARFAAIAHTNKPVFALQFHPEVVHTPNGRQMLENFLIRNAMVRPDWTPASFINETITSIKDRVKGKQVILGLSGGVDSSVVAALIYKAIGNQLKPIFVDTGLLRKNEAEQVRKMFSLLPGFSFKCVDAGEIFLQRLTGVIDPEQKRKIIGRTFIEIFEEEAKAYPDAVWLAQGTLYPDVIESNSFKGPSVIIKSHHNVGGLPEKMHLNLLEPLRELFKDEVRKVGRELGLPDELINRHPFPGPGLAVRIIGDITPQKVKLLQDIDAIFISELHNWNLYNSTWQAFAVLLPIQSVGVMGDERTYDNVCALRAVNSMDGMTADWTELPASFLKKVSNRIINEVSGINRVVYDISSKPPATIEWE